MFIKKFFSFNKIVKWENYITNIKNKFDNPTHDYPKAYKKWLFSLYRSLNYEYNENFKDDEEFKIVINNIEKKGFNIMDNKDENFISIIKNNDNFKFEIFSEVQSTEIKEEITDKQDLLDFAENKHDKKIDFIVGNGQKLNSLIIRRRNWL